MGISISCMIIPGRASTKPPAKNSAKPKGFCVFNKRRVFTMPHTILPDICAVIKLMMKEVCFWIKLAL